MAFWHPIASIVTVAPLRSSNSTNSGMTVISLPFFLRLYLPQREMLFPYPGAHHMSGGMFRPIFAPPYRFTVDIHRLPFTAHCLKPGSQA
jgi:hypothetical protein